MFQFNLNLHMCMRPDDLSLKLSKFLVLVVYMRLSGQLEHSKI